MANIKSAKKRVIVNRTKAERNKAIRSEVKISIKKVEAAVAAKDLAAAQAALKVATATIESACSKASIVFLCFGTAPIVDFTKVIFNIFQSSLSKDLFYGFTAKSSYFFRSL